MRLVTAIAVLLVGHHTASAPVVKAPPSVVGTARAGAQITGLNGTWGGSGTITYTYAWDRCDALGGACARVEGATRPTYLLTDADVGKTLGLVLTAKNASGSTAVDASLVGPIAPSSNTLADVGRPFVSGTAATGSTLGSSAGIWTSPPSSVAYSWLRCSPAGRACAAVAGASGPSYGPVPEDVGHTLVARVQATLGATAQVVLSTPTAVVVAKPGTTTTPPATTTSPATTTAPTTTTVTTSTTTTPGPPSASSRPVVTGTVRVGQRLSGTTAGASAYQWYRCDASGAHCSSIHGATKATYTVVAADAGNALGLTVQLSGAPVYASLVGPVAPAGALASTGRPGLTGTPQQGQTLTVTPGGWTAANASVTYAWERCNANGRVCAAIPGATAATYAPVADDVGHALVAIATATSGGKRQSAFSVASDDVAAPPPLAPTTAPAVTGTLRVGQRLTGTTGVWTGLAPITYAFQWYRCDAGGAHCSSVRGATKPTYRLVAADKGKTLGLTVNATDATGAKQPAYASLVGLVADASALAATAQPIVTVQGQTLAVVAGAWTGTPSSTTVQWERCNANGRICAAIAGATSIAYTLTSADAGHMLAALVTAHAGATTAAAFSDAVKAP